MALCIVCNEREGTAGLGDCCTTNCFAMTEVAIQAVMDKRDILLKERQIVARENHLGDSLNQVEDVPATLKLELEAMAKVYDTRTS